MAATKIWYTKPKKHNIDRQQRLIIMQLLSGSIFTGEKLKEWRSYLKQLCAHFAKDTTQSTTYCGLAHMVTISEVVCRRWWLLLQKLKDRTVQIIQDAGIKKMARCRWQLIWN